MSWFKAAAAFGLVTVTACETSFATSAVSVQDLPFRGETSLLLIEQTGPDHSVAIVESCAPFPAGCKAPQLKARSLQGRAWEFADLRNCKGAERLVDLLLSTTDERPKSIRYAAGPERVKTAKQHTAEDLLTALEQCLSKSYMTPPWAR